MLTKATYHQHAGLAAAGLLLGGQAAFADPGRWQDDGYRRRDRVRSTTTRAWSTWIRSSATSASRTPRRECWNETRYEEVRYDGRVRASRIVRRAP